MKKRGSGRHLWRTALTAACAARNHHHEQGIFLCSAASGTTALQVREATRDDDPGFQNPGLPNTEHTLDEKPSERKKIHDQDGTSRLTRSQEKWRETLPPLSHASTQNGGHVLSRGAGDSKVRSTSLKGEECFKVSGARAGVWRTMDRNCFR